MSQLGAHLLGHSPLYRRFNNALHRPIEKNSEDPTCDHRNSEPRRETSNTTMNSTRASLYFSIACAVWSMFLQAAAAAPVADYGGHQGAFLGGHHGHHGHGHYGPAHYGFQYGVHDPHHGANFGHHEEREGYTTRGSYYVNLPDGRLQKVEYIADEYGFRPIVSYEGHAHYPSHGHHGGYHGGHGGHGGHGY